ncbi:MAG: hypothetical protein CMK59_08960 [Proteobacteria bacterium]|nr:hypothetical protein [Pseudomonadota bacterium]
MLFFLACAVFKNNDAQSVGDEPIIPDDDYTNESNEDNEGNSSNNNNNNDPTEDTAVGSDTGVTETVPTGFDCEQNLPIVQPESVCFTKEIRCGDEILMTTEGGTDYYERGLYTSWYAMPNHDEDYDGLEHAFYFWHPGSENATQHRVDVILESPCENMDLYYFQLPSSSAPECYNETHGLGQYSHDTSQNNSVQDDELAIFDSNYGLYLIIVESRSGVPSPFKLSVECGP